MNTTIVSSASSPYAHAIYSRAGIASSLNSSSFEASVSGCRRGGLDGSYYASRVTDST